MVLMGTKLRFMRSFMVTTRVTLQEVGVHPTAENRPRVPSLQHRGRDSTTSQHRNITTSPPHSITTCRAFVFGSKHWFDISVFVSMNDSGARGQSPRSRNSSAFGENSSLHVDEKMSSSGRDSSRTVTMQAGQSDSYRRRLCRRVRGHLEADL